MADALASIDLKTCPCMSAGKLDSTEAAEIIYINMLKWAEENQACRILMSRACIEAAAMMWREPTRLDVIDPTADINMTMAMVDDLVAASMRIMIDKITEDTGVKVKITNLQLEIIDLDKTKPSPKSSKGS